MTINRTARALAVAMCGLAAGAAVSLGGQQIVHAIMPQTPPPPVRMHLISESWCVRMDAPLRPSAPLPLPYPTSVGIEPAAEDSCGGHVATVDGVPVSGNDVATPSPGTSSYELFCLYERFNRGTPAPDRPGPPPSDAEPARPSCPPDPVVPAR